jgi:hypothetical protein
MMNVLKVSIRNLATLIKSILISKQQKKLIMVSLNIERQVESGKLMIPKRFKNLPEHLQPRIISAVSFIHRANPNMDLAQQRIAKIAKVLTDKELMYVMSLLVFDKLLDMVKNSGEFKSMVPSKTLH